MKYIIDYALCCNKGKLRRKNQDNFFCEGELLPAENEGLVGIKTGRLTSKDNAVLAVLDGMGGEQMGEKAAFISASTLGELTDKKGCDCRVSLEECCLTMNRRVCDFAAEKGIRSMGSTACLINFAENVIRLCNIGDSKIYHFDGSTMLQLSVDHCMKGFNGKSPLTQFIGVPEEEFIIQPHCTEQEYNKGDVFLICSDGLTDMVSQMQIQQVLASSENTEKNVERLLNMALEAGGRDNITVLICRVKKKALFW